MNKLYEFLKDATEEQLKEWTDNTEDYDFNSPPTKEDAFDATVDWVINDLKNMYYSDLKD